MIISLRTTSYAAAVFVAIILGFLLLLSSRQYRSHKYFEKISDQNEKIIFQFATIREHISDCLLEGRYNQLKELTTEVEHLNANISQILQEPIIPDHYRLSFASQVDLAGIILLLRTIGSGDHELTKIRQLNQEVRVLGDRLTLFDRVIVNHIKRELVGFQTVVIGILATLVFVIINILIFWHYQVTMPLFSLIKQAREVVHGRQANVTPLRKGGEIAEVTGLFNNMLFKQEKADKILVRQNRLQNMALQISSTFRQADSREAIFSEACKTILTNSDYCLVWIGAPDGEDSIVPIAADGSTTMSRRECDDCMSGLLTAAQERGPEYNAPLQASKKGRPIVIRDILAGIPKGTFKNTPFAAGYGACAALPIAHGDKTFGILTLYSISQASFSEEEIEILNLMAVELGLSCHLLDTEANLAGQQLLNRQITSAMKIMAVTISAAGDVVGLNAVAEEFTGKKSHEVAGRQWTAIMPPAERQAHTQACKSLLDGAAEAIWGREMQLHDKKGNQRTIRYSYSVIKDSSGRVDTIVWTGVDITDSEWLSRSRSRLQAAAEKVFQTSDDLVFILDKNGTVLDTNPVVPRLIGVNREQVVGQNISPLLFGQAETPPSFIEAMKTGTADLEIVSESLGREYRIAISRPDSTKTDDTLIVIARDLSVYKKHDEVTIRASKLAAMGELALDVAHEINNLSNGLINYSQLLSEELAASQGENTNLVGLFNNVIKEGERIAQVVQQLLVFNANRSQLVESVQIEKVIQDAMALIKHQLNHDGILARVDFPSKLPPVRINIQKMQHVFLNLLSNARYALNMRYSGRNENKRLAIEGETASIDGRQWLKIHITDWGTGIDPAITEQLFEPFFSTKPDGEGTGLGLSISKGLVMDYQGEIQIDSIPGDHTTVTVALPVT